MFSSQLTGKAIEPVMTNDIFVGIALNIARYVGRSSTLSYQNAIWIDDDDDDHHHDDDHGDDDALTWHN